jgi:ABC-type lipoprotein release transport system permease subunit
VLGVVVLGMFLVALVATWKPAHRVLKINPSTSLRDQ